MGKGTFNATVNDIQGGYEYPEVVHFKIEELDLLSYLRPADFPTRYARRRSEHLRSCNVMPGARKARKVTVITERLLRARELLRWQCVSFPRPMLVCPRYCNLRRRQQSTK